MQVFDNVSKIVKDDLEVELAKGSKLSIAAAYFSIYAYKELKSQLDKIEELRFIFTSPTFTTEKAKKENLSIGYSGPGTSEALTLRPFSKLLW